MEDIALNVELKSDKIKIFVTGKFGVGKSTFINGLFSGKVEAEIGVRSRDIRGYTFDGVTGDSLVVYDTPGQELNSTSYLQWIGQNCSDDDLVFFCVQMSDQIRPEDTKALASLAKVFGRRVWDRLVIVLTHANQVAPVNVKQESKDAYYSRIKYAMANGMKEILTDPSRGIKLSAFLANKIPIIPAGHPREYSLPDCLDWRSAIVEASSQCMDGSSLEKFIRDDTLKVTHSVTVSCVSERDAWFWKKLFVGCVCIAGGVILIFTSRKGVGAVLSTAGCMMCYWTLHKKNRLFYVQHVF